MNYMVNYENMSDFEINKRVAERMGGCGGSTNNEYKPDEVICYDEKPFYAERDYCNNPSDAWPIIEQIWGTLMSVTSYDFGVGLGESKTTAWEARANMYKDGKLRAAMIVYLMMQENNQ